MDRGPPAQTPHKRGARARITGPLPDKRNDVPLLNVQQPHIERIEPHNAFFNLFGFDERKRNFQNHRRAP